MRQRVRLRGALVGTVLWSLGTLLEPGASPGVEPQSSTPPRPAPQPTPTPPTPQPQPVEPTPPMPERVKPDAGYLRQLEAAAAKRKARLDEATARADDLLKRARARRAEIATDELRRDYTEIADKFVHVATDMQGIVNHLRVVYDDPAFQDEQLHASTNRMVAMDQLLTVMIKMLRDTERMSTPIAELAGP